MAERLLIIGATGFVGSRWALVAGSQFEVICASRHATGDGSVAIDITNRESVRAAFDEARPDFVTHLAAMSDIDRCERERDLAEQMNYFGTVNVAKECARIGARLLYTSTDAVFDGTKHTYYEHDLPTPLNWYGQTKARAEKAIGELLDSAAIVRPSLVLGRSALPGGNSYLDKVARSLEAGTPILTPTFEYRNPIDIGTLCKFFGELTPRRNATGIFHIGASDKMSRYEMTRTIARKLGRDTTLVVAQDEPVSGRAPRGRDDFLVAERVKQFCRTPIPTCQQVIERAIHAVA